MQIQDERNILHIGPPQRPCDPEVTPVMAAAVRERIAGAGGNLTVWAVLHDDRYDSPVYSDEDDPGDIVLSLRGIALNSMDAERLAALGPASEFSQWIVKRYQLGLVDGLPAIVNPVALEDITLNEEPDRLLAIIDSLALMHFSMNELAAILCEIPPGGTASKLLTGSGRRSEGPLLSLP